MLSWSKACLLLSCFFFIKSIFSVSWNQKWGQELLQEPSGKGNLHGGEKHILKRKKKYFYSILKYEFRKLLHTESNSTHRLTNHPTTDRRTYIEITRPKNNDYCLTAGQLIRELTDSDLACLPKVK